MNQTPAERSNRLQFTRSLKIVFFVLGGAVLLFFAVLLGLYFFLPEKEPKKPQEGNYHFYAVTDQNIFENREYLAQERRIFYWENADGTGLKSAITDQNRSSFDAPVQFLEAYINTVITGDRIAYRMLFTDRYLRENTLPEFTPQMLYDIEIRPYSTESLDGGAQRATYQLDYKILYNNGTYRRDVGSDEVRTQYVVLLTDAEGKLLIDEIYYFHLNS